MLVGTVSALLMSATVLGAAALMTRSTALRSAGAQPPGTKAVTPPPRIASGRGPAQAAAPAGPSSAPAASSARAMSSARVVSSTLAAALFPPHSWHVEPPPPPAAPAAAPAPPPAPTAPPLPFTFVGSYTVQGDQATFFLARGDRIYDVKVGDEIDTEYTFVAVNGENMIFNYKPLNTRQSLALGEGK